MTNGDSYFLKWVEQSWEVCLYFQYRGQEDQCKDQDQGPTTLTGDNRTWEDHQWATTWECMEGHLTRASTSSNSSEEECLALVGLGQVGQVQAHLGEEVDEVCRLVIFCCDCLERSIIWVKVAFPVS